MVRKIKKKKTKQERKQEERNELMHLEMTRLRRERELHEFVNLERKIMYIDCALSLAWTLRNECNFGKKRLVDFLDKYLDTTLDWRSGRYFDKQMMLETLKEEIDFDFEEYIVEQMKKHVEKLEQWEKEVNAEQKHVGSSDESEGNN